MERALEEYIEWQSLENCVLDSRFEIVHFLQRSGAYAFFRGRAVGGSAVAETNEVLLRVEDVDESSSGVLDRFREATFFDHANLIHVLAAGEADLAGRQVIYLVTEMANMDLAEAMQQRPRTLDEIADLLRQLASGLNYVHSENLVYCALRAGSVWRVGDAWKLADFSQLRIAGTYPLSETRKLLLMPGFDSPPEANEGSVTEAWDVWSLGSMLRKMLIQTTRPDLKSGNARTGSTANVAIPPPYDRILRDSLDPDPAVRPTFEQILATFSEFPLQTEPEAATPEPVREMAHPFSLPDPPAFSITSGLSTPPNGNGHRVSILVGILVILVIALAYLYSTDKLSSVLRSFGLA